MKALAILLLLSYIAFQILAITRGQANEIGYAIGYSNISISCLMLMLCIFILEKIDRLKK